MQRPERSSYTPLDFLGWREGNALDIVPKFQRRGVWTAPARSYLIDSLILGMPVPPIYIRVAQSPDKKRIVREIIDGQQRTAAVLDYMDGKYSLSRSLDAPYSGKRFDQLTEDEQDSIRQYSFICEVFHGVSDAEVLEIFARMNTYSVNLNAQELRNGKYFGLFKQSAYRLAREHIEFWRRHKVFSERSIARMLEVEHASELMIVQLDGLQDQKKSLNKFYAEFDEEFKNRSQVEANYRTTIDSIEEALSHNLEDSEFHRPPLFYSLFCSVYHHMFGLPHQTLPTPRRPLGQSSRENLRTSVTYLSERIDAARQNEPVPAKYSKFVNSCLISTDNLPQRKTRFEVLYGEAFTK